MPKIGVRFPVGPPPQEVKMTFNELPSENKGDPRVISPTEGEEITPQNPEIVKQFPVDLTDKKAVEEVENAGESK